MPRPRKAGEKSQPVARLIGRRIRALRIQQRLTQTDLQKKTGLLRSHISRVENGWRTPSVETLERLANALQVPLYSLFHRGYAVPAQRPESGGASALHAGSRRNQALRRDNPDAFLEELRKVLLNLNETDRETVLEVARRLARRTYPEGR